MRATNEYLCRPYSYYDMTGKLDFHPKFLTCIRSYSKSAFLSDLMAGVIVGIVALPLAIAFAIASGVSPEKGIITAVIAGFIVSFLGGSKVQIGGPTGAFIVIVYGVVQQYGLSGLAAATVMAGVLLILLGVFKLGTVIKFIPYPVVIGFTSGIAVTIFTTQMADVFGLTFGGETVPGDFIGKWMLYFRHFDTVNWWDAAVSLVSVAIIVIVPRIAKRVPGSLVAIVLVTVAVYIMKNSFGITGIDTIGDRFSIDSHLPKAEVPSLDWEAVKSLFPIAVTIAALGAIESLLSATVADGMISDNHNSNTELIALGNREYGDSGFRRNSGYRCHSQDNDQYQQWRPYSCCGHDPRGGPAAYHAVPYAFGQIYPDGVSRRRARGGFLQYERLEDIQGIAQEPEVRCYGIAHNILPDGDFRLDRGYSRGPDACMCPVHEASNGDDRDYRGEE